MAENIGAYMEQVAQALLGRTHEKERHEAAVGQQARARS
jgi:hypothetical protein